MTSRKRKPAVDPEIVWKKRYDELNAMVEPLRKESLARLSEASTLRNQLDQARVAISVLCDYNQRLRGAAQAFKRMADRLDESPNWVPDTCPINTDAGGVSDFTVGYLRRLRAVLTSQLSATEDFITDVDRVDYLEREGEIEREAIIHRRPFSALFRRNEPIARASIDAEIRAARELAQGGWR